MAADAHAAELTESDERDHPDANDANVGDAESADHQHAVAPAEAGVPRSPLLSALIAGLVMVVVLAALTGWLSYRAYQSHQVAEQRRIFLDVGRQAAVNLTTLNYAHVDADMARVLDSATGSFYDDFKTRAQALVDVVRKAQSTSVGTVAEAGVESVSGDEAQVLVAVEVKTSIAGAPSSDPRGWRMRINVRKVDGIVKVSNVVFVP